MRVRIGSYLSRVAVYLTLGLLASTAWAESSGDIQGLIDDCAACHGDKGASTNEEFPIIGGMSAFYLEEQLLAYQKERPCEQVAYPDGPREGETTDMCEVAKALTEEQIQELAAYYAEQAFVPADQEYDPELAAEGASLYEHHCKKCHSRGGSLAFDDAGILAGQWRHYLEKTFQEYRAKARWQPEKMEPKMDALSDEDVKALIEYFISQGDERFGEGGE